MANVIVDIERIGSRIVYENKWMRMREDAIRRKDGSTGMYGVVEKPDFVVIVPVEDDGSLHLVQQFRYPVQDRYWELPQGTWEQEPGIDPLDMARGELREETGLDAASMTYAGHLFEAYGYSNQGYHIFLATGLLRGSTERQQEEQDLVTQRFPLSEIERMIRDGEIKDGTTVATLGLLRLKGLL